MDRGGKEAFQSERNNYTGEIGRQEQTDHLDSITNIGLRCVMAGRGRRGTDGCKKDGWTGTALHWTGRSGIGHVKIIESDGKEE